MTKVGHTGTLDPFASGVLLVLLGPATRLAEYIHLLSKTYEAQLILEATSDTDDPTGKISKHESAPKKQLTASQINNSFKTFIGPQKQIPPAYSAIKIKGERAYKLARQHKAPTMKPRPVHIFNLQVIKFSYPRLNIITTCSSGTYIRSLARDIGKKLKTGAYLNKLVRTSIGPNINYDPPVKHTSQFNISKSIKINEINPADITDIIIPPSKLIAHLPQITIPDKYVAQFYNGQSIEWGTNLPNNVPIAVFFKPNKLSGIAYYNSQTKLLSPKKVL